MRQVTDEADRVGEGVDPAVIGAGAPGGRIEGGEQGVLDQHSRGGQPVQQAGLAGVGVAGDGDRWDRVAATQRALGLADDPHRRQLAPQLGDALGDPTPVDLELRLAGTAGPDAGAAGHPATPLPGQRNTPATQPRQQVVQLGEFDLRLALLGAGVLGEDVQDQRGAVDHLDLQLLLQVAQLAGRQLAVADHRVGAGAVDQFGQLDDLARADVGRRVGAVAALDHRVQHHRAGGLGEPGELGHRLLGFVGRRARPDADEHDPFELELPVLDLGDVGELGGQALHAAQRGAVLEVTVALATAGQVVEKLLLSLVMLLSSVPRTASEFPGARPSNRAEWPTSHAGSTPAPTSTAGPVSVQPAGSTSTSTRPPGTSTTTRPASTPSACSSAAATATVPVPQDRVSPTPARAPASAPRARRSG